jgi:CubicO group peptidase (beta-lactamase class C family)
MPVKLICRPARLLALLGVLVSLTAGCALVQSPSTGDYWPTHGWRTSAPEAQGMDSLKLAQMLEVIQQEPALNLHSLLVIRQGYLVSEVYFTPAFGPNTKHILYSVTKSFISTLVGIALDKGYIDSLHHPVLDYFPRRTIENRDTRKEAMTVEDLLTMRSGLDWQEGNSAYVGLAQNTDAVKYVLDEPMIEPPGTQFLYCSGCSHVLSGILQQLPGVQTLDFAKKNLFAPLGISDYQWDLDSQGVALGGWGLYLKPRDMAKLGYLYLHNGLWDGRQIVSAAWVKTATATHTDTPHKLGFGYGYQWWTYPRLGAYMALGAFGQVIFVAPASDLVVVVTADQTDLANEAVFKLIEAYILTAVKSSAPLPANPTGQSELAAQIKASQRSRAPAPLLPSAVRGTAGQWSALLLGFFGLWAVASRSIYLGGEVRGRPALGAGLLALIVVAFQFTHQSTCSSLFSTNWNPDPGALVLSLAAIFGGWQAGRASVALLPAPRRITAAWVFLACGVAAGCLLGIALATPALFTLPTFEAWARPLLLGLGMTVGVLALLHASDPAPMVASWPAALTGGSLIGWLFGYLGAALINLLRPASASLSAIARQGLAPLLASLTALWPSGTSFAEVANHSVVLLLIVFGCWVMASRKLYLGGSYQITGWGVSGLGLLVLATTLFESHAGQNNALAAYLLRNCFGSDSVAYLLSLGMLFGGLLASRTSFGAPRSPADATQLTGRLTLARLFRTDWLYTALGLAMGCLLGVALRDPVLLSGATPWLTLRLGLMTLGLAGISLGALLKGSPTRGTMSTMTILAGGLFLGWVLGYLGESIAWALWPFGV